MINVMTSLLEVSGLTVELSTVAGWVRPVKPVSALNVSVGAQVLLLLQDLQREFALTYIFISHSLPVVAQVATRIAVMRAGQFVETGPVDKVLQQPQHDYTRELLSAVPELPRA
ncbi:MAG: hypothetical protein AUF67_10950 [Acidobacteria bacterium 13_1_20CM_58_21]|nr:MAG: hypothetical protein AUF67_10950 [Acidobacteria bacterium 13_1_20CM_58_21]